MARAVITQSAFGTVTLEYDAVVQKETPEDADPYSVDFSKPEIGRVTRHFVQRGMYVFEVLPNGREVQVCNGFRYRGLTLMVPPGTDLISVIRATQREAV